MTNVATTGRVVIVGASLAGLSAAEALREEGFSGHLTIIGDEPYAPYDRPPLSKTMLTGWLPVEHTTLPRLHNVEAEWLLGVPAAGLDLSNRQVRLAAGPRRVLVIGAGFTGSEVASVCRELGVAVTVAERSPTPLAGALGQAAGAAAAQLQRQHGVDLRCNITVMALEGDAQGRLRRVQLSDGDALDIDVAVVALGALRNTEWLAGCGLAADARGVVCDGACRAFDANAIVSDEIFVAGDVARWPHPLYEGELIAVEHWGNAVEQAATAAHNMVCAPSARRAHRTLLAFWSNQFGVNLKSIGLPTVADEVVVTQGSVPERRFVAAYGRKGRIVAAVTINMPRWLPAYQALIEAGAPFPPQLHAADGPAELRPVPAGFPPQGQPTHSPGAVTTGPGPTTIGCAARQCGSLVPRTGRGWWMACTETWSTWSTGSSISSRTNPRSISLIASPTHCR